MPSDTFRNHIKFTPFSTYFVVVPSYLLRVFLYYKYDNRIQLEYTSANESPNIELQFTASKLRPMSRSFLITRDRTFFCEKKLSGSYVTK